MALSSTTIDHDEIREWIEARGGRPTVVATTHESEGDGLIRIDFAEPTDRLEEIPWDEFFEIFEKNNLAFLHQDQTAAGEESRFFRFLQRDGTDQGDDGHESKTGQGTGSAKVDGKTSKTKSAGRGKKAGGDKPKAATKDKAEGDKPKRAAAKKSEDKPKAAKKDEGDAKPKRAKKDGEDKPKRAAKKAEDKPAKEAKPKKAEAKAKKDKGEKDEKPKRPAKPKKEGAKK